MLLSSLFRSFQSSEFESLRREISSTLCSRAFGDRSVLVDVDVVGDKRLAGLVRGLGEHLEVGDVLGLIEAEHLGASRKNITSGNNTDTSDISQLSCTCSARITQVKDCTIEYLSGLHSHGA